MSDERGVGVCPDRPDGLGHLWAGSKVDGSNPCRFCGTSGRVFFAEATAARSVLFRTLRTPDSAKGIKPKEKTS